MHCFRLGCLEAASEMRVWGQVVYVGGDPRKPLETLGDIKEERDWAPKAFLSCRFLGRYMTAQYKDPIFQCPLQLDIAI